jgi:hypothetical protein
LKRGEIGAIEDEWRVALEVFNTKTPVYMLSDGTENEERTTIPANRLLKRKVTDQDPSVFNQIF